MVWKVLDDKGADTEFEFSIVKFESRMQRSGDEFSLENTPFNMKKKSSWLDCHN